MRPTSRLRIRLMQRRLKGREGIVVERKAAGGWRIARDNNGEAIGVTIDPGKADGRYGPRTEEAVAQWEAMHGLKVDGKAGRQVLRKLAPLRAVRRARRRRRDRNTVIPRERWNPAPPRGTIGGVAEPTRMYFDHCTVSSALSKAFKPGATMDDEALAMKGLQSVAFSRGFLDISYSFVVFMSGRIWEARGWDRSGAHTEGFNSSAYAIAAYIPCAGEQVSAELLRGIVTIGRLGRKNGAMIDGVDLRGHREVAPKGCPGDPIFNQNPNLQQAINA